MQNLLAGTVCLLLIYKEHDTKIKTLYILYFLIMPFEEQQTMIG